MICAAPFAADMAVCFLLSVMSRPLGWEIHHLLCFALTHVPPKMTFLSCRLRLRLLFLLLAPAGLWPINTVWSDTAEKRDGKDSPQRTPGLRPVEVDWLVEDPAPKPNSSFCVTAGSAG